MNASRQFVSLVALFAFAILLTANASAFADITSVTVNGIEAFGDNDVAGVFAGETIPVRVIFDATQDAEDVRVVARLLGSGDFSEVSERFDVIEGNTYSRLLNVRLPFDIDPNERNVLEITIESRNNGSADSREVQLEVQRSSYEVEVLSVANPDQIRAGKSVPLDIVLKNRGRQFAEDTYVRAQIPQLGISTLGYFGDLSPEDQDDPDKEDAVERRLYLNVPSSAPAGVYTLEIEAFNTDSSTKVTKRVVVIGAQEDSMIVSSSTTKTFGVGESARYTVTLVNSGDTIQLYNLVVDAPEGLTVSLEDSIVAVPAGTSKTVAFDVSSNKEGSYAFSVDVQANEELVKRENYVAKVDGNAGANIDATVLVTVVLAIIFIVLIVVLIVLLTRRPSKKEEFGESYY